MKNIIRVLPKPGKLMLMVALLGARHMPQNSIRRSGIRSRRRSAMASPYPAASQNAESCWTAPDLPGLSTLARVAFLLETDVAGEGRRRGKRAEVHPGKRQARWWELQQGFSNSHASVCMTMLLRVLPKPGKMTPMVALLGAPAHAAELDPSVRHQVKTAIGKGLDYLAASQNAEGYWTAPDLPGLSALAVQAFLLGPDGDRRKDAAVEKGLKFIRESAKPDGGIYNKGLSNYNTSVCMTTLLHADRPEDRKMIDAARNYLIGAQKNGDDNPTNDGGFGYDPEGESSRPDLSNTAFVVEAMALYQEKTEGTEFKNEQELNWNAAVDFLSRCQNLKASNNSEWVSEEPGEKGGFTYTPGGGREGTRSYGAMTYTGLLSMIYAKVDAEDPRVKAAVDWLSRRYSVDENPGLGDKGLYYYYFVMSKALTASGLDKLPGNESDWRTELATKLIDLQRPDGSWVNTSGRWMESDPVLVTSYSVLALDLLARGK